MKDRQYKLHMRIKGEDGEVRVTLTVNRETLEKEPGTKALLQLYEATILRDDEESDRA